MGGARDEAGTKLREAVEMAIKEGGATAVRRRKQEEEEAEKRKAQVEEEETRLRLKEEERDEKERVQKIKLREEEERLCCQRESEKMKRLQAKEAGSKETALLVEDARAEEKLIVIKCKTETTETQEKIAFPESQSRSLQQEKAVQLKSEKVEGREGGISSLMARLNAKKEASDATKPEVVVPVLVSITSNQSQQGLAESKINDAEICDANINKVSLRPGGACTSLRPGGASLRPGVLVQLPSVNRDDS